MTLDDHLTILKFTIAMEAEGESELGKLAVAYTIMNRVIQQGKSISDVCLAKWQFSAWNTDSNTRLRLDEISDEIMEDCWEAAQDAYYKLQPDPTAGATHYLNMDLTRELRGGTLPSWVSAMTITTTVGKHTFLK